MTDKQIKETLMSLKSYCYYQKDIKKGCGECRFKVKDEEIGINRCQIQWFLGNMTREPWAWNVDKLGRIAETEC